MKREASKNGARATLFASALVNINGEPLFADSEFITLNEGTKELNYPIFIKYQPMLRKGYADGMDFILGSSLLPYRDRARLVDFEDLKNRAAKDETEEGKALRWILENTDICEEHFDLAKANFGIRIFLNFDMLKYAKKINPDWKSYPTYVCGLDIMANSAYNKLRVEGLQEKDRINKRKEAKRCQQ